MINDEFLQDFVDEAKGHIEKVEGAFLDTDNFKKSAEMINDVFRAIHSIKGTAGFFKLDAIVALSHAMENVLGLVRSRSLEFTDEVLDCLLACTDTLKAMVYDVEHSDDTDISSHLESLENIINPNATTASQPKPAATPKAAAPEPKPEASVISEPKLEVSVAPESKPKATAKSEFQTLHIYNKKVQMTAAPASAQVDKRFHAELTTLSKKGHKAYKVVVPYDSDMPVYYKEFDKLLQSLREIGQVLDIFTDLVDLSDSDNASLGEVEILKALDEQSGSVRVELLATSVLEPPLFADALAIPEAWILPIKPESYMESGGFGEKRAADGSSSGFNADESIRVSVKLLENLVALSGEMVLARNQIMTAFRERNPDVQLWYGALQSVDRLASRLQQQIMLTRMQPIGSIFSKFPRVIRDISKNMNKDIALTIEGKEIELDKTMLESLSDPLIHLVRNAADHGIEPPEQREKAGKPSKGTIALKAFHKGGMVAVEVADDGGGIDVDAVKRKAVASGIITKENADSLSDNEVFKLLFLPGFSTAAKVSDISGRGVGMDVVQSNIEKLGGAVQITSEKGVGTTTTMMLPRTLAITQSLIVVSAERRFVVPQSNVIHVVNLKYGENRIEHINKSMEFRFRGKLLPVISLADILELKGKSADYGKIVLLDVFKKQFGLLVDEILDAEEILVKPLPAVLKPCGIYSGVTILGDGKVSLILDPEGIAAVSRITFAAAQQQQQLSESDRENIMLEYQSMMMFKCSGPEMYAIDLNMVSRVETISASDIEEIGEQRYAKIRGRAMRVISPENYLPVQNLGYKNDKLTVIIPNLVSHPIGILAEKVIDNTKSRFILDTEQIKAPGIFGSIIYKDRIALILNIYELFEIADPLNHPARQNETEIKKRVLIVEDTPFFQHIEKKYLQDAGCDVTVAENGKEALELLRQQTFDIIISDLIMPVMGGLELIQNIRKDSKLQHIPAIALSSMTADNYIGKALEYGFDAFENKLNKETLLKTVANIIKSRRRAGLK